MDTLFLASQSQSYAFVDLSIQERLVTITNNIHITLLTKKQQFLK